MMILACGGFLLPFPWLGLAGALMNSRRRHRPRHRQGRIVLVEKGEEEEGKV